MKFCSRYFLSAAIMAVMVGQASAGTITATTLGVTASANAVTNTSSGTPFASTNAFDQDASSRAIVDDEGRAVSTSGVGGFRGGIEIENEVFAFPGPSFGASGSASSETSYKIDFENTGGASQLAYGFTVDNPRMSIFNTHYDLNDPPFVASLGVDILLNGSLIYDFTATLTAPTVNDWDFSVESKTGGPVPVFDLTVSTFSGKYETTEYFAQADSFSHVVDLGLFNAGQTGTVEHIVRTSAFAPGSQEFGLDSVFAGIGDPPFLLGAPLPTSASTSSLGPATVPEPSSILAFGCIALAGIGRRKRR